MSTKLLESCFVSVFDLYKEYNNCLILFLSFSELFPDFDWAKEIGIYWAFGMVLKCLSLFLVDFVH